MKYTNYLTAVGLTMVFVFPVFAGNDAITESKVLAANVAKASSPENVKVVALQQKTMYCEQNAKNKKLQGINKEVYLATCLNKNDALMAFEAVNNQRVVSSDINEMLNQSPTGAGSK